MDLKEKILREKGLAELWNQIKEKRNELVAIGLGKKINAFDAILMYQCISIILENITVYEEKFKKDSNSKEARKSADQIIADMINKLIEITLTKCVDMVSAQKKIKAIEETRQINWEYLYKQRIKLIELSTDFMNYKGKDSSLLYQCVYLVLLEIDLKQMEIDTLDKLYSF